MVPKLGFALNSQIVFRGNVLGSNSGPVQRPTHTARSLNATAQSRVTLSLQYEHLRAARGPCQEERSLTFAQNDPRRIRIERQAEDVLVEGTLSLHTDTPAPIVTDDCVRVLVAASKTDDL